ncbi:Uncharacterized protein MSYG_1648 [Malassezia sympodialis ATCC 42132]|uniref:Uncharacterized protein n=2 Tax=Malassezia sympodialis (strain ATCC 42132) TaxID=1230383 RepID=A0A1M8A4R0_MALS4|nr:Uncharacterized protein MSYG_1648 [Malassezia sympodialis ATCC 42132]
MARPSVRGMPSRGGASSLGCARDIKARLFEELGPRADEYWRALVSLCTAAIDRAEFQARVQPWLPASCVVLHNSLVLSMMAEASAPVSSLGSGAVHGMQAPTSPIRARTNLLDSDDDSDDAREPPVGGHPGRGLKRLRHMYAGLSQHERKRLQSLPKTDHASLHTAASVWAGAGAELLERKRKEDEKRRAVEERRRTREAKLAIGASHWRLAAMQTAAQADSLRSRLSPTMQETLARSADTPHCIEAHELPDVYTLQDRMSLAAIEVGLSHGVHVQAAAVLLAALQDHLRAILRRTLAYSRGSKRSDGSRIRMPDIQAVLDLAPHVLVEPLGQGPLERLLAPDGDGSTTGSVDGAGVSWVEDDAIRRVARECATTKLASHSAPAAPPPPNASHEQILRLQQQTQRDAVRDQVILDQLAPLRLLDRPVLRESLAQTDSGLHPSLSTPMTVALEQHYQAGHHHHHHQHPHPLHRHKDEFFDVVDPMALLGSLCKP